MDVPLASRDRWMRRAGPFFPLLVAARAQTRLPVAIDLTPTREDEIAAQAWSPVVGALLGLALGFSTALIAELGLVETAVAAIVASIWVLAGGAWAEVGTARRAARLLDRDGETSMTATGSFTIALVVSLLLRVALLTSIDLGAWTGALFVAAVVSRWAPLCAENAGAVVGRVRRLWTRAAPGADETEPEPMDKMALIVTVAVAIVVPAVTGAAGFVALLFALGAGLVAALTRAQSAAPWLILATELGALLCFAVSGTFPLLEL